MHMSILWILGWSVVIVHGKDMVNNHLQYQYMTEQNSVMEISWDHCERNVVSPRNEDSGDRRCLKQTYLQLHWYIKENQTWPTRHITEGCCLSKSKQYCTRYRHKCLCLVLLLVFICLLNMLPADLKTLGGYVAYNEADIEISFKYNAEAHTGLD